MRGRRQRREDRRAMVARAHGLLPPEELGRIMAIALVTSVVGSVFEVVVIVAVVRTAIDAWRRRGDGFRAVVRVGRVRRTLALLGVFAAGRLGLRAFLLGSLRRSVQRADAGATERP